MSEQRFEERKQELKDAVLRLEEAIAQPENDMIRDSVIQRFEFSFELAWKTLQLFWSARAWKPEAQGRR